MDSAATSNSQRPVNCSHTLILSRAYAASRSSISSNMSTRPRAVGLYYDCQSQSRTDHVLRTCAVFLGKVRHCLARMRHLEPREGSHHGNVGNMCAVMSKIFRHLRVWNAEAPLRALGVNLVPAPWYFTTIPWQSVLQTFQVASDRVLHMCP